MKNSGNDTVKLNDNQVTEQSIEMNKDDQVVVYKKPMMGFCDESSSGKLGANNCCNKC